MKEALRAFEILGNLIDEGKIIDFSFKSETGIFNIEVEIRHKDFKDYDSDFEVIELDAEEVLNNKLDEEIKTLVDDYYKRCIEALEDDGYDESYVPHDTSLLGMHYAY